MFLVNDADMAMRVTSNSIKEEIAIAVNNEVFQHLDVVFVELLSCYIMTYFHF